MNAFINLFGPGILLSIPVLYAAVGGLVTYRAGFFNIALEGFMLISAYFSVLGAQKTGSLLLGTLIGVGAAVLASAVMGVLVVYFGADDVIVGIAVNLAAVGLTTYLLTASSQNAKGMNLGQGFPQFHIGALDHVTFLNQVFNNRDLLTWVAIPVLVIVGWFLSRTRPGLCLTASGEAPLAARAAGVKVDLVRLASFLASGLFCGVGGAELAIGSVHLFSENMTSGRGVVAFAAVIFGAGRVRRVSVACLFFGFAQAAAALLQIKTSFPSQIVLMLPYLLTIVAVTGSGTFKGRAWRRIGWSRARPAAQEAPSTLERPVALMGHLTVDEIHLPDGTVHEATVGGASAYAALGGFLSMGRMLLVSRVGAEYPLDRLRLEHPNAGSIDASATVVVPGESTHNIAWYGADGSRRWEIRNPETMHEQTPRPEDADSLELDGRWVLINPASLEQQTALAQRLTDRGARVAVDTELHYLSEPDALARLTALTSMVDCFLPSREHVAHLTGFDGDDPAELADVLDRFGCPLVVMKCGAGGARARDARRAGGLVHVPAVQGVRVVDPTGAGDAFNGGMLVGLSRGESLTNALVTGCVAASFVIESIGLAVPDSFSDIERGRRQTAVREHAAVLPLPQKTQKKVTTS